MRTLSRIERKPGAAEGQDDGRPHVQYNSDDCSLVRAMQRTDGHKRNAPARETFPGETGPLPDRISPAACRQRCGSDGDVLAGGKGGSDRLGHARRQPTILASSNV